MRATAGEGRPELPILGREPKGSRGEQRRPEGAKMAQYTEVQAAAIVTEEGGLRRAISWKGAFWVAAGVPALVLFSIGGIAGTVGIPAFAVWAVSMVLGFIQSFTYAEIAGLFPNKSGGASVY